MAFGLTLLYLLTTFLSPPTLFGPLAEYHAELIIAVAVALASIPNLRGSRVLSVPTLAIGGLSFAVFMSLLLTGWIGSAPRGIFAFLPCIYGYFLVLLNCRSLLQLRLLVLTLFFVAAFVVLQGSLELHAGLVDAPYLYDQGNGDGTHTARLRGLSFINDPNDFSQFTVSLIPLMFFFRRGGRSLLGILTTWPPICVLLVGLYLAHSRGAAVALMAVILFAARKRIGTIPAVAISGLLFAATTALNWSGGRETSVDAGQDRLDAWATGLQLIKTHPVFGVGYVRFSEYYYITAHNSIVVCAAELGVVGFFFWVLFTFATVRSGVLLSNGVQESTAAVAMQPTESSPGELTAEQRRQAFMSRGVGEVRAIQNVDQAEVRRLAGLLVICLTGYLVAGWFLSRAYVVTLFLYGGMMQVLVRMAYEGGFSPPTTALSKQLRWTGYIAVFLLAVVYAALRLRNLTGR